MGCLIYMFHIYIYKYNINRLFMIIGILSYYFVGFLKGILTRVFYNSDIAG